MEVHNSITMRQHQWVRILKLLVAQFPQESRRKVNSLLNKWEKLRSTYSRIKKLRNQTGGRVQDVKVPNSSGTMPLMKSLASRLRLTVYRAAWTKAYLYRGKDFDCTCGSHGGGPWRC